MELPTASQQRAQVEAFRRRYRTGLVTLLFTDIVGSTQLKQELGDREAIALIQRHHAIVRQVLGDIQEAAEISTAGDSFFLVFAKPSDAVKFSLLLQAHLRALAQETARPVFDRIGIHVGEVFIEETDGAAKVRDIYGIQVDTCARVMSLGQANQILMTRFAFDNARQVLKGRDIESLNELNGLKELQELRWLNHGPYLLKGVEEPIEICEVRVGPDGPVTPPTSSDKAQRYVSPDSEPVLGWRPALDQIVPGTEWVLEQKLGEGGFGEVWLGRHKKLKDRRVFKFCFRLDRVRSLKREVTLFRLLKERIGAHPNIVGIQEVFFDEPPFYIEMEYVGGKDLKTWSEERGSLESVPLETRLEIVAQAAEALHAAHAAGVIHRDVKPGNILISTEARILECGSPVPLSISKAADLTKAPGPRQQIQSATGRAHSKVHVKLTDFGIGQVVSEEYLAGITRAGFTQTMFSSGSSHTGTHLYMAPELLAGKPASARSDIYSLGVVMYQLLRGDFSRPLTTDWAQDISDPLLREDLVRCFAGDPDNRFANAGQLAQSLRSLEQRQAAVNEQKAAMAALAEERVAKALSNKVAVKFALFHLAAIASIIALALLLVWVAVAVLDLSTNFVNLAWRYRLESYVLHINVAHQALENNNLERARELLIIPFGHTNQLSFEWRYLWKLCQTEAKTNTVETQFTGLNLPLRISRDSQNLIRAGANGTVDYWSLAEKRTAKTFKLPLWGHPPRATAISPNGDDLAVAITNGGVEIWNLGATNRFATLRGHTHDVNSLAFSPDGRWLATSSLGDLSTRLWNLSAATQEMFFTNSPGPVEFSPDSEILAAGSDTGAVRLWNIATKSRLRILRGHGPEVKAMAFSPDSQRLATANSDQLVRLWKVESGTLDILKGHLDGITCVTFSSDGRTLVTGSHDRTVKLWNVGTGYNSAFVQELMTFKGWTEPIWSVMFSPDGNTLLIHSGVEHNGPGLLQVWNAPTFAEIQAAEKAKAKGP